MRLLVTRPEPDAGALAEELRRLGHEPVLQPLLEFQVLEFDPAPILAADGIIFTSRNAVRALGEKLDLGRSGDCAIFCVGSETERLLRSAGFKNIAATADTAEELAAKIVAVAGKDRVLTHVTGRHQAFDLAGTLKSEGLLICTLSVYSMQEREVFDSAVAAELEGGKIGGAILMSPRTAEIFVALCRRYGLVESAKRLHYFCLASSAANRLRPLEPIHVHVAQRPDRAALLGLFSALPTASQDYVK